MMPGSEQSDASATSVHADYGVAAGGDILNNTIQIIRGLNEQEVGQRIAEANRPLGEQLAALAEQVARDKGVPLATLRAVLGKFGEADVADDQIPQRLNAKADEYKELVARLREDRPELAEVRKQALELIDQGDFDRARAVLSGARYAARSLREAGSRNEAELLTDEARLDHLQLAYRDAAAKYAEAAALIAPFDHDGEWVLLMRQASELWDQGKDFGDNGALSEAAVIYNRALDLSPRETSPLRWARV
jgi:tetratricopeptide (TPR) repeat protein